MSIHIEADQDRIETRGIFSSTDKWMKEKGELDRRIWGHSELQWVVENKVYDLTAFAANHPGGSHWIQLTRGQDITELFNIHHLDIAKARTLLDKYYLRDTVRKAHRFKFDGLYARIKNRVLKEYSPNFLQDSTESKYVALQMLALYFSALMSASLMDSWLMAVLAGALLVGVIGVAHNFVHFKTNYFRYLFNLSGFRHSDWQIFHAISHHNFPNMNLDYELGAFEPLVFFIKKKNFVFTEIYLQLFYLIMLPFNIIVGLVFTLIGRARVKPQILLTLAQVPFIMLVSGLPLSRAVFLFTIVQMSCGYIFTKTVFCGHRQTTIWFEGMKRVQDFAEHTAVASNDNEVGWNPFVSFLFFSGFNIHIAHHLFPTIDHSKLPLVNKIVVEELKGAGIHYNHSSKLGCMVEYSKCVVNGTQNNKLR